MTNEAVWKTLSSIDVSDKTEKKGNLTYLSWAWAWGKLMENFPQATYTFTEWEYPDGTYKDVLVYDDGTCSVECEVKIEELSRKMWLPVMDYRNNAIPNPSARQISDTKMRCLVKCLAMFGLGHYIYAGEDLPRSNDIGNEYTITNEQKARYQELLNSGAYEGEKMRMNKWWKGFTTKEQADSGLKVMLEYVNKKQKETKNPKQETERIS